MAYTKTEVMHEEKAIDQVSDLVPNDIADLTNVTTYEPEPETAYKVGWRTWAAVVALSLSNACAAISNTTNTTIKFQVETVGDPALASWIGNSGFLLTLAFAPVFGSLSDRLGKKWFIVGGSIFGIVGCCIAGSAHTIQQIIAGQILVGVGNAGCIVAISANQEVIINKYRPYAFGINQTIGSTSAVMGVFIAAAFVKYNAGGAGGWPWAYYFNAIFYAVAGLAVALTYFPPKPKLGRQGRIIEILSKVDYIGGILLCASIASLLIGLTWGGSTYAWNSGQVIATLTCGCVGLVLLGLYEAFIPKEALFDHRLFRNANFPILVFVCLVDGMLLLGVNVLYSQEISDIFTTDAVTIATILSPYLITSTFGCFPAGWLMGRTKSYRVLLVGALLWTALFTGLMALINSKRLAMACVFSALFGIGTAVTTVIPIVALTLSVPSFLLGTAGTISVAARALGGIVGITIFTAIFNNKFNQHLAQGIAEVVAENHFPTSQIPNLITLANIPTPTVLLQSGLPQAVINGVLKATAVAKANSWTFVWVAVAAVVAANAVVSCFLKSVKPRMNAHIESALEQSEVRRAQLEGKISA